MVKYDRHKKLVVYRRLPCRIRRNCRHRVVLDYRHLMSVHRPRLVTDLSQEAYDNNVCDFIGYEIKDSLRTKKKAIEEEDLVEEPELEKVQEQPITIIQ